MENLFDQKLEDATGGKNGSNNGIDGIYAPKLKDAPQGVYSAKLRFLPNMLDPSKVFNQVTFYKFSDAYGDNTVFVPSKKNWGEKCPITELWFKLKKSPNPAEQALKEHVYFYSQYYSYVLIVDDKIHPELNGKVMLFRYGNQIYRMIQDEVADNGGTISCIIHPTTGSDFMFKLQDVGGFNNYTSSKFVPSQTPVVIDGNTIEPTEAGLAIIKQAEEALGITVDVENVPWSEDRAQRVADNLATYNLGGSLKTVVTTARENLATKTEADTAANETGGFNSATLPESLEDEDGDLFSNLEL